MCRRLRICFFCVICLFNVSTSFAQTVETERRELVGEEKDRILGEINAKWEAQKNEIVTAEIHYKSAIFHADKDLKPLSSEEIREILQNSELDKSSKNYIRMIEKLTTLKEGVDKPIRFGADMVLYQDVPGQRVRENNKQLRFNHIITDGLNLIHMATDDAATIHNVAEMIIRPDTINDFRWIRTVPLDSTTFKEKKVTAEYHYDGQNIYEETSGEKFLGKSTVDVKTGLILYDYNAFKETGQVLDEHYYLYPIILKNNIAFPKLSVRIQYDVEKKRVAHIVFQHIEDVVLNRSLPKNIFQISVPAETIISDFRKNTQSPTSIKVHTEVPDIVAFMDGGGILPDRPKGQLVRRWSMIIIVNLGIIGLIIFLRYRQIKSKKNSL